MKKCMKRLFDRALLQVVIAKYFPEEYVLGTIISVIM